MKEKIIKGRLLFHLLQELLTLNTAALKANASQAFKPEMKGELLQGTK